MPIKLVKLNEKDKKSFDKPASSVAPSDGTKKRVSLVQLDTGKKITDSKETGRSLPKVTAQQKQEANARYQQYRQKAKERNAAETEQPAYPSTETGVVDSMTGTVIDVPENTHGFLRVGDTLSGAMKGSASSAVGGAGSAVEGMGVLNRKLRDNQAAQRADIARENIARYQAMLASGKDKNGNALDAKERQRIEKMIRSSQYTIDHAGDQGAFEQGLANETALKAYQKSDKLNDASEADLARAKDGLGTVGQMMVDAGASFAQSMTDAAIGSVTGTGMLPFVARSLGGSMQEARRAGEDFEQQLKYGSAQAAKEWFTEKMFGLAVPNKMLGKSGKSILSIGGKSVDDVVRSAIDTATDNLAKTEAGRKALGGIFTWIASGVTEGAEEAIGDLIENTLINPTLKTWEKDERALGEKMADAFYDFMVGGMSGLMGVTNLTSYQPRTEVRSASDGSAPAAQTEDAPASGTAITPEEYLRTVNSIQTAQEAQNGDEVSAPTPAEEAAQAQTGRRAVPVSDVDTATESAGTERQTGSVTAQQTVPGTIEEVAAKYGKQAEAVQRTYNDGQDVQKFESAFGMAFDFGKKGASKEYAMRSEAVSYLTEAQKSIAYDIGKAAAGLENKATVDYTQTINNETEGATNGEGVRVRDGGQWPDGQSAEGQAGAVAEGTGRVPGRNQEAGPRDSEAAALSYGEEVSTSALGIQNGSSNDRIRIVQSGATRATAAAQKLADGRGLKLVLFGGGNIHVGNVEARACIIGDTMYVRADHAEYTAEQLTEHEVGHDRIAKGEINVQDVRDKLSTRYTPADMDGIAENYAMAVDGAGMTAEEIWEEIICDSLAGINVFSGTSMEEDFTNTLVDTWDATNETVKENATRGPPTDNTVRTSRESKEDGNGRDKQRDAEQDVQRTERAERGLLHEGRNREDGRSALGKYTYERLSGKARGKVRTAVLTALNADAAQGRDFLESFGSDTLAKILYDRIIVNGETLSNFESYFPDLRKSLSLAALEAQGIENDYVIDETTGKAAWTPEHIEWLYKAHSNPGSETETNYAKAYAVYMSPADFLSLTATDSARARIELESVRKYGELDSEKLKSDMGSPYLDIDFESGTVTGHEGRHRMVLMQNAGIEQVPVVITPYEQGDKYNRTVVGRLRVSGQEWTHGKAPGKVTLRRIVPLSSNYRSEVEARFSGDAEVKFSRDAKASRETKDGKYWRPDLKRSEWDLLNRRMEAEIEFGDNYLDKATKWVFASEKGTTVFAIYGIGDGTVPTPLYAVGGSKAVKQNQRLTDHIRRSNYGTYTYGRDFDRWLATVSDDKWEQGAGIHADGDRRTAARNGTLSVGEQKGDGKGNSGSGTENRSEVKLKFSMEAPVEQTRELLALHNKDEGSVLWALRMGGLPMPSIAVVPAESGHTKYGPISIVFRKDVIDPETDSRNKVYGGDAYTPTAPSVEYPVNYGAMRKAENSINDLAKNVANGIFARSSVIQSAGVGDVSSMSIDEIAEKLGRNETVKAAYLADKGTDFEPEYKLKQFSKYGNQALQTYIDKVGAQKLASLIVQIETGEGNPARSEEAMIRQIIRDTYEKEHAAMLNRKPELKEKRIDKYMENNVSIFTIEDFIKNAWELYDDGGVTKDEIDRWATLDKLNDLASEKDVSAWVNDRLDGILGDPGIYNGKDRFTPSGRDRTFKELHWSYTLENIVKAMTTTQKERGGQTFGVGATSLQAVSVPDYGSISDIKADSNRLGAVEGDAYTEQVEAVDDAIKDAISKVRKTNKAHSDNTFDEEQIIGDVMMKAANGKKTVDAIVRTFKKEGYTISTATAKDIQNVYKAAAALPTEYFEAKPQRVVGANEWLAVVAPDNSSKNLFDELSNAGVNVLTYESGNEADRLAKVNSIDGARFSRKGRSAKSIEAAMRERAEKELRESRETGKTIQGIREENALLEEKLKEATQEANTQRARAEKWKGETKRTETPTLREEDVRRAVGKIAEDYESVMTKDAKVEVIKQTKALGEYIMRGGEGLRWTDVKEKAMGIATIIVENAESLAGPLDTQTWLALKGKVRTTPIAVTDTMKSDIADYADFRARYIGRLNLANSGTGVDQFYQELASTFGDGLFPSDIMNPTDQLLHIAQTLDTMQPVTKNPHSFNMAAAIEYCANDLVDELLSENVRQTAPTFADKAEKKLTEQIIRDSEKLERLREQKNQRIEELKAQGRETAKMAVRNERSKWEEKLQKTKDHYDEVRARARERRDDSRARNRLLKIVKRLKDKKLPAVQRSLIDQLIGELDTVSVSMTGKSIQKLTDLRQWYEDQKQNNPDFIADPKTEERISRLERVHIGDMTVEQVAELTEVLLNIENEIRNQRKLIDTQDRRDTYHMGEQVIRDIEKTGGSKGSAADRYIVTETLSPVRQVKRMVGYADNDPLLAVTNSLADGQRKALDYQMRAEKPFESFAADKEFNRNFSGPKAGEIKIIGHVHGTAVGAVITPAMRVSLYLHSLNDDNLRHVAEGGITIPDMKLYKKGKLEEAYARGITMKLSPSEVRAICKGITEQEKSFAMTEYNYFNNVSKPAINETSEKLVGYSLAAEEHYFPINTDTSFTKTDFDSIKFDGSIEGMGFLKERANAKNPIMLRDANMVLEQSIQQHSKYVGLAIPVRNFNKLWSVTTGSFNEDGSRNSFEGSVQSSVKKAWGENGYKYIEKMMRDVQGAPSDKNVWAKAFNKVRSNYAGAVLTLNLSVAMKQAASYPTAAAVTGWKPLVRAMTSFGNVDLNLIAKHTPLQWYRSKGFSTKELGDLKTANRQLPKLLNWVQGIDLITTRKLWKAAEYYVQEHNKALSVGSDAYYKSVADIYNRIIEETQPNYTTMQRPQLLRSDDTLMGNLAMFKTQPFQNFNILYDAAGNLKAKAQDAKTAQDLLKAAKPESKKAAEADAKAADAALKSAKTDFGRAVTSQIAQLAVFSAMTMAWAFMRGKPDKYEDDDGELTGESVLAAFGKDMIGGALSTVPFGADALEFLSSKIFGDTYYGMDTVTVTAVSDTLSAIGSLGGMVSDIAKSAVKKENIDWNGKRIELDGHLDKISKVLGVPYENVANIFNATVYHTLCATKGKILGKYYSLLLTTDPEKKKSAYYDAMWDAYRSGDEAAYSEMVQDASARGMEESDIEANMKSRYKKAYQDGQSTGREITKKLVEKGLVEDEDEAYWLLKQWDSTGPFSKYDALYEAVKAEKSISGPMKELTSHGYTEKDVLSQLKTKIGKWYKDNEISGGDAINMFTRYCGMSRSDAEERVRKYDEDK